ncbi:MAG: FHA domain-containing protein [Desulfobacterales bacterium]|nr:FHA domain-containing protein [Desulfobacterales bacterium]
MKDKISSTEKPIRITREEALSSHVDDILKRLKSLTGQAGVSRDHKVAWYFQNWFLFGIAGALAAFAAWALIEPYFEDRIYIQGEIESVDLAERMPDQIESGFQTIELNIAGRGWLKIRGQKIWLSEFVVEYRNGETAALEPEEILAGREVGVYLEYYPTTTTEGLAVAGYIVLSPPHPPPETALTPLSKISKRHNVASQVLFPLVAGAIGLAIGAIEGIVCRLLSRAIIAGLVGMLVGLVGGYLASIPAGVFYELMTNLVMDRFSMFSGAYTSMGFFLQTIGRSIAWGMAGMAMGLGQGIALKSGRLLLYGFLGGVVGGLAGGLAFDPIDIMVFGLEKPSAHWSRMIGFTIIGLSVGLMIGVVQLLARDAWLRMTEGPLAGKEFLFFKDTMTIGASPKCEIYLFNDALVRDRHAALRAVSDNFEIESLDRTSPVLLNDRSIRRTKLRHGDRITIGKTSFIFQMKNR